VRLSEQISKKALELGFDLAGITDASPLPNSCFDRLAAWVDCGYAGRMAWMLQSIEKRVNPASLLGGAQSVIVVALNYKPALVTRDSSLEMRATSDERLTTAFGTVASYARYGDYHPFIKRQLRKLVDFLIHTTGPGLKFKICVDSSPLLERALAERAGLGFIGKNHMLINRTFGPQLFLGEIITNLNLEQSKISKRQSAVNNCGSCNKCVAACPTGALRADGHFDATKCISYLTIESDTEIPSDLAPKIGNRLFGCSECLLACPYQQKAPSCSNPQFAYFPDRAQLNLNEILNLTEDQFQIRFAGSPILRPDLTRLKHTAQICLNNLSNSQ
jgi:epoxyqueuosine reductase